jgi:hypothetical protein
MKSIARVKKLGVRLGALRGSGRALSASIATVPSCCYPSRATGVVLLRQSLHQFE